jgi:hypothetical protein
MRCLYRRLTNPARGPHEQGLIRAMFIELQGISPDAMEPAKKRIEDAFTDSLAGRLEVWVTGCRRAHDQYGEGWITCDKQKIITMGVLTFLIARWERLSVSARKVGIMDMIKQQKTSMALAFLTLRTLLAQCSPISI